jgi:hypothetical protein
MTKWSHGRINKRLLKALWVLYKQHPFTNYQAYTVYTEACKHHSMVNKGGELCYLNQAGDINRVEADQWARINTRNYLYVALWRGILKRVYPGVYQFNQPFHPSMYDYRGMPKTSLTCKKIRSTEGDRDV